MEEDLLAAGDWVSARVKLDKTIYQHAHLIGVPGRDPFFNLRKMGDLKYRYINGERSLELYETIMKLE